MTGSAIWEGLMEEEPECEGWVGSDQCSLWNGRSRRSRDSQVGKHEEGAGHLKPSA